MLLDSGADPNASGPGYTVLHVIPSVRKPSGGDNDPAPDGSGNMTSLELIRKLVAKGANINARMTKKIAFGLTSLNDCWRDSILPGSAYRRCRVDAPLRVAGC